MVPAGNNEAPTNYVQACITIKLCSKPCDGVLPAAAPPLGRSDSTAAAARRVSLAGAGKTASIKSGADHVSGTTTAAGASSTDAQQAPQQPLHAVQIKLLGLDGLQQELPAAAGTWVQTSSSQCCEYISVPLPDLQLAVTEQRVLSWAAAAAQLQVQVTVLSQAAAADTARKPGGAGAAAGAKGAPPAPAAAASGTLVVNCAGLLAGDTTAAYRWGNLPPAAAAVQDAAGKDAAAVAAGAPAAGAAPMQQATVAPGQVERYKWHMQPPSGTLLDWLESAEVQVQLFKPPPGAAELQQAGKAPAAGAKPPAPKHAGAARMSASDEAATEHAAPPEPCSLLNPELASVLNPVVVYAYKAACLPDGPASRQQLETLCEPVKLKAVWPPMVSAPAQPAASLGPWTTLPSSTGHDRDALSVRTAIFAAPTIIFGADVGQQQLLQLCRCTPVQLQVRDRTALPEPAPFTAARMARQKQLAQQQQQQRPASGKASTRAGAAKQTPAKGAAAAKAQAAQAAAAAAASAAADAAAAAAADGAAEAGATVVSDDGEVYASAAVSLADLVKGRTGCCFNLPLQPVSTIRGGSCLDWKSRPGRYLEANSHIKGWVRCAAPLHLMHASMEEALAATAAATAAAAAAEAEAAAAATSQTPAATPPGGPAATPASTSGGIVPSSSPRAAPKPAPAGKAVKAPAAASAAGARVPSAAPVAAPASATAAQATAADQQETGDAAEGAQYLSAQPEKLPQPAAHVMLPSDVRYKGTMTRAVFRMDYRDSDLLHVLEDSVRQHNAIVLGLAPPPPPTPEELAAIKAAEEAAAAAALAAAEAAAAAAAGLQRGRSRPSSSMAGKALPRASLASASKAGAAAGKATPPQAAGSAGAAAVSAAGSTAAAAAVASRASEAGALDPALASKAAARRASAAGTTASGTPRSILKQPQQLSAAGGLSPLAPGLAAEPSTLTSGMASSRQHQQGQQHPRASFAGDLESCGPVRSTNRGTAGRAGDESDSDAGDSSDEELSEADVRLQAALQRYDHVDLDQRLLQALSTYQLSPEQVLDESLDVLTGYHLVDGDLRLFMLEGPAEGKGMQHLVTAVARWAFEDQEDEQRFEAEEAAKGGSQEQDQQQQQEQEQEQEKTWLPRHVLFNPSIRYPARMYGSLGVDLWMLKLHSRLSVLGGTARTFTGHVRPECIAGMKCLLGMVQGYVTAPAATSTSKGSSPTRTAAASGGSSPAATVAQPAAAPKPAAGVVLMRQLDLYNLFPTAEQLHLVDKKFGGELTKADVLGVEAEEDFSDDEDEPDLQQPAQHTAAGSTSGKPTGKAAQPELTGSHAAAAAAKAASVKLQQLLADSTEMGSVPAATAGAAAAKSLKSRRSSRRSGKGSRSRSRSRRRGRRSSTSSKKKRAFRPKHALDMDNSVYLHLRMEAHRRRVQRDIMAEHMQALSSLSASKQPLREAWATWNPQRAAARELQQQIEQGNLTLEDTIKAYRDVTSPVPPPDASHLDPEQATTLGWYPHGKPWMWPAPRDPATYNMHPLQPSEFRVEELQEAWQEGGLAAAAAAAQASSKDGAATNGAGVVFDPLVRPRPHGLFTQDPEFWQTVHLGGDNWEDHLAQQAAAAKAEWADKVVVKDIHFHALPGTKDKAAAQADRMTNLLKGKPVKKGFKVAHTPPPPVSMYIETPWQPPAAGAAAGSLGSSTASADKTKCLGKDFDALCNKQRSVVAKPGFSDATTAALHDKASP